MEDNFFEEYYSLLKGQVEGICPLTENKGEGVIVQYDPEIFPQIIPVRVNVDWDEIFLFSNLSGLEIKEVACYALAHELGHIYASSLNENAAWCMGSKFIPSEYSERYNYLRQIVERLGD